MKQLIALTLCLLCLLGLAACQDGGAGDSTPANSASGVISTELNQADGSTGDSTPASSASGAMPTVLNQTEYVLYQNVFFNDQAGDYLGKTHSVEGTLARVTDAFSEKTRYYVWGYMDATKCCDWQWEFVPADPDSLPANGSLVQLSGTMVRDEAALDKIWLTDVTLELKTAYEPAACDVDLSVMNATLERVQLLNMQYKPDYFQGKSLVLYGRAAGLDSIQHPYYDNAWTQKLVGAELPAIGTMVLVSGTWQGDSIQVDSVRATADY